MPYRLKNSVPSFAQILYYPAGGKSMCSRLVRMECEWAGPELTQAEGFILGVGAKMFTIAGPVIVYGVSASVVYGLIYWIIQMISGG